MPIFIWSDFIDRKIDLVYLFEKASATISDLEDVPIDSAALKAILTQTCSYSGNVTKTKNFFNVVFPQYIVCTKDLPPEKAMVKLAMETFRLKTRHFRAPELGGDGNIIIAVKKEGTYFLFFSDTYHYVLMHHWQSPLHSHHFCFLKKSRCTTEYIADCAVQTQQLIEKYTDFVFL